MLQKIKSISIIVKVLNCALMLLCTCTLIDAQEQTVPTYKLGEIVVTATKTEKLSKEVPASVSVITSKDLETKRVQNLDEHLNTLPGCYVKRGKGLMDSTMRVSLRGLHGQERTLVLVDGQPLNDPYYSSLNWSMIPMENIERVEVVRGPYSALYGGNAMAGVINIITKKPTTEGIKTGLDYGTYNTKNFSLSYANKLWEKLGFSLGFERKETDGYINNFVTKSIISGNTAGLPEVSGWEKTTNNKGNTYYIIGDKGMNWAENQSFTTKFYFDVNKQSKISASMILTEYKYGYDEVGNNYLRYVSTPTKVAPEPVSQKVNIDQSPITVYQGDFLDGPGGRKINIYNLGYENELNDNIDLKANFGFTDMVKSWYITPTASKATAFGGEGKLSNSSGQDLCFDIQSDIKLIKKNVFTTGINYKTDTAEAKELKLDNWKISQSTNMNYNSGGKTNILGLYLQDEISLFENLTLFAGIRYDSWETYSGFNDDYSLKVSSKYPSKTQSAISPKIGVVYRPFEKTILRMSAGQAFRPPTTYDLYRTWKSESTGITYMSNPELNPETVSSWEMGIEQNLWQYRTTVKATYFENYIDKLIYNSTIDAKTKQKTNSGKAETKGAEIELNQNIFSFLSAFANYTYSPTKIVENPANTKIEGKQVPMTVPVMYNIGLNLNYNPVKASLVYRFVDKSYNEDDNSDIISGVYGSYDSYSLVNAQISYSVNPNFTVSLSCDNLFDTQYYQYYKAQGRTFTGKVQYKY